MDPFVVRDDISEYGLRRVHLLHIEKIDPMTIVEWALAEDSELEGIWEWEDADLNQWHLYGVWRIGMSVNYPMYCVGVDPKKDGALEKGLFMAIGRFMETMHMQPNRVVVREGLISDALIGMEMKDGVKVELEVVTVKSSFPVNVVGVYAVG